MNPFQDNLTLSDFDFEFPPHLVAHEPLSQRDESRVFVRKSCGSFQHSRMHMLPDLLEKESVLVLNDTKVFASRILAHQVSGRVVQIFLLSKPREKNGVFVASGLLKPARKVKEGEELELGSGAKVKIISKAPKGEMQACTLEISGTGEISGWLENHAYVPLPPYIKRSSVSPWNQSLDSGRYQTVYANEEGSVAAPTAGLHFSQDLFESLRKKKITICPVTLHVGAGTFLPVKTEDVHDHVMHSERYTLSEHSYRKILDAKRGGRKIIAVGTTSFRCVESFLRRANACECFDTWMETDLFIFPRTREDRYRSQIFDGIITNFHQPRSTLFMLVSSLIGFDEAQRMYKEAVQAEYRLISYGDSSLLWF